MTGANYLVNKMNDFNVKLWETYGKVDTLVSQDDRCWKREVQPTASEENLSPPLENRSLNRTEVLERVTYYASMGVYLPVEEILYPHHLAMANATFEPFYLVAEHLFDGLMDKHANPGRPTVDSPRRVSQAPGSAWSKLRAAILKKTTQLGRVYDILRTGQNATDTVSVNNSTAIANQGALNPRVARFNRRAALEAGNTQ
ncbi:hypothetical protein BC832DRAFT_453557 [Gaertneriomyces semiglobifer]|nr:hypothetical protein BC832DRAFT_453557 [Gaertneriomyces semiglobifer]